ncbi:MAG: hypothetical protein NVSMB52_16160 [Chloroflexota bacterium]
MADDPLRAVLDVGSNTIRLLVASVIDGRVETVLDSSEFARLGKGVDASGALQAEQMETGIAAIQRLRDAASELGVDDLIAIATSAVRDAKNGPEFISRVRSATGVSIRIISGEEEADLTFRGATIGVSYHDGVIVCDLGGGSAELVYAHAGDVLWSTSQPLGSGRLTERFVEHDPPHETELDAVRQYVERCLQGQPMAAVRNAVFTGGTATHVGVLAGGMTQRVRLSLEDLGRAVNTASSTSASDLVSRYGFTLERSQVLAAGSHALLTVARYYNATDIAITKNGVREGVLLSR